MCLGDKGLSKTEKMELLLGLKADLEKEGFRVTWLNPFFEVDGQFSNAKPFSEGMQIYVANLPVPEIAPCDVVTALISVERDFLYFSLCVYFCRVMDEAVEAPDIHEVYDHHDGTWFPALVDYFQIVQEHYCLQWDVEYDSCIEDSLYGHFPLDGSGAIISLMRSLLSSPPCVQVP